MRKNKGFTLIELLVVIAIIGLLATLAVVALNNARAKSRDARRVSDIKQIQTALELFYNDHNGYPAAIAGEGTAFTGTVSPIITYMGQIPGNPDPGGIDYSYAATGGADSYLLYFVLESGAGGMVGGVTHTAHEAGLD